MPDAARARDSPGPNIRMLQKTIAGCRVSSQFFRRACTRAASGGPGDGPSGGRRPLKPGTARHGPARPGTAPTARTQQANRFFSTIFQYFVHIARFAPSQIAFSRQIFRFLSRKVDLLHGTSKLNHRAEVLEALERPKRPSDRLSFGPLEGSVPSKASARAGMRGPRRAEARGPRRAVPKAASDRRSKASRPLVRSACRLYAPDAELAGTKVMRW